MFNCFIPSRLGTGIIYASVLLFILSACKHHTDVSGLAAGADFYGDLDLDQLTLEQLIATSKSSTISDNYLSQNDALPREEHTAIGLLGQDKFTTYVSHRAVMAGLENKGFSFGSVVSGSTNGNDSNGELQQNPAYDFMVRTIEQDLASLAQEDSSLGSGMKFSRRLLNSKWLRSPQARFELSGVINRMDLQPVFKMPGTCGALVLTYRLSYATNIPNVAEQIYSRLPVTAMAIYSYGGQISSSDGSPPALDCQRLAQYWRPPADRSAQAVEAWLTGPQGPMGPEVFNRRSLISVAFNAQVVRWPSSVKKDLGGNARYLFRQFDHKGSQQFTVGLLPGTIDVPRIKGDKTLRNELFTELSQPDVVRAVDQGTYRVPERYLASKVLAASPYGLDRPANRLYDEVFKPSEFNDVIARSQTPYLRSGSAYLARLNDGSCVGCHQGRAVAGFHFLGQDGAKTHLLNSLAVEYSDHFRQDQERRSQFVQEVANGQTPSGVRNISYSPGRSGGSKGSYCSLPTMKDPTFASWQCASGLKCIEVVGGSERGFGRCADSQRMAGSACAVGQIRGDFNSPMDDSLKATELSCAANRACSKIAGGFPGGMCNTACAAVNEKSGETCAFIAGDGFNTCVADGKLGYQGCLNLHTAASGRGSCDYDNPCREDYVCARTKNSTTGACVPTYFLFQIRLDGHPEQYL